MKKRKGFKLLGLLLVVLALGIGYAAISATNLTIKGTASAEASQDAFKVIFTDQTKGAYDSTGTELTDATVTSNISTDALTATFSVSGLSKKGDYASFVYTVQNQSDGIAATISTPAISTYNNSDYFDITITPTVNPTLEPTDTIEYTVLVTLKKTPLNAVETGDVTITMTASPTEADSTNA